MLKNENCTAIGMAKHDPKHISGSKLNYQQPEPLRMPVPGMAECLLKSTSTKRQIKFTPKSKLYRHSYWKRATSMMKIGEKSFQERLYEAEKFSETRLRRNAPAAQKFFQKQAREATKHSYTRRFTIEEKILALTLFKSNPENYNVLYKLFMLPSTKTLKSLLQQLIFKTGINKQLFDALKKRVSRLRPAHRLCTVMFDEISLMPHLDYNTKEDMIYGFVDNGHARAAEIADHALVFMVRGIKKQYKQPVAFSFCSGTTRPTALAFAIKEIIEQLQKIKLKVVATVCDQAGTNKAAINRLIEETAAEYTRAKRKWPGGYFEVNNQKVVPIFDVPQLIMGIRNHLLTKDLKCVIDGRELTAKWDHIVKVYEYDKKTSAAGLKVLPNLTDCHLAPNTKQKMVVRYATQVFSQRVGAFMWNMVKFEVPEIPREAEETAMVIIFLDKLFDSLNSSILHGEAHKPLTSALSASSKHLSFWQDALQILKSVQFIDKEGEKSVPHSVNNLIKTIEAVKLLWEELRKLPIKFVFLRNLNLDPLENFFALVRRQGVRNIKPTCANFVNILKILTINNFTCKHFIGNANREEDESEGAISNMKELLFNGEEEEDEKENILGFILKMKRKTSK